MDDRRRQRLAALKQIFEEEMAADLDAMVLHLSVDRLLELPSRVEELKEAGLHSQAEELLRRINEMMPGGLPAAAGLPAPSHVNGVPAARPPNDAPPRRGPGRPPKPRGEGSTP